MLSLIACRFGGGGAEPEDKTSDLVVINESSQDICYLYLSSVDEETWGEDQLEDDIIEARQRFTLEGIPAGVYDVRFEPCDETYEALESYEIDLNTDLEYTITD
jgi:hypothetical protein